MIRQYHSQLTSKSRGGAALYLVLAFGVLAIALAAHYLARNFSPAAGAVFFASMLMWGFAGFMFLGRENDEELDDPRPTVRRDPRPQYHGNSNPPSERVQTPTVIAQPEVDEPEEKPKRKRKPSGYKPVKAPVKPNPESLPNPEPPPILSREERYEQFQKQDFREAIAAGVNELTQVVETTKHKMGHYQKVMGKRMHKSTGTEHQSLISLRKLIELLEERREALKAELLAFEEGKASREEVFKLLNDDLVIPHDPVTALPGEKPIPPVPRDQWILAVDLLCRQVARKPSFLQLLRSELLSGDTNS